jgi:hypothetical protein
VALALHFLYREERDTIASANNKRFLLLCQPDSCANSNFYKKKIAHHLPRLQNLT